MIQFRLRRIELSTTGTDSSACSLLELEDRSEPCSLQRLNSRVLLWIDLERSIPPVRQNGQDKAVLAMFRTIHFTLLAVDDHLRLPPVLLRWFQTGSETDIPRLEKSAPGRLSVKASAYP